MIALITEWQDLARGQQVRDEKSNLGGTMRLGAQEARLQPGSLVHSLYGKDSIFERHRHRYEFNNHYLDELAAAGLRFSGFSTDGLVEFIELPVPSVVRGEPVPSGVHLDAARRASAVHRLHPRRAASIARHCSRAAPRHEACCRSRSGATGRFS